MSVDGNTPNGSAGTPPAEGQPPATPPVDDNGGGLPSANDGQPTLNFELTDTIKEKFITADGKLLGKYENLEQIAEAHKNLQDKHAQYVEDVKNREKEIDGGVEAQKIEAQKLEKMQSLLPEFLKNDMQLTPEMQETLTEAGIDVRDVKLGAIELRDKIKAAHEVVGGAENYQAMMVWASEQLNDAEKAAFDADVMGAQSRFAIKGLYSEYEAAVASGEQTPPQRINGDNTVKTTQPYGDRAELLKDRAYVESPQGKRDLAAQKRYRARLAVTPDEVWRGY